MKTLKRQSVNENTMFNSNILLKISNIFEISNILLKMSNILLKMSITLLIMSIILIILKIKYDLQFVLLVSCFVGHTVPGLPETSGIFWLFRKPMGKGRRLYKFCK